MKKCILILMLLVLYSTPAWAQTIELDESAFYVSSFNNSYVEYVYTAASVAAGDTQLYKIRVPRVYGVVVAYSFESASTECYIWASKTEIATVTSTDNVFSAKVYGSYSPDFKDRDYVNKDEPQTNHLWFYVNPTFISTDIWKLSIFFAERK